MKTIINFLEPLWGQKKNILDAVGEFVQEVQLSVNNFWTVATEDKLQRLSKNTISDLNHFHTFQAWIY